MHDEVECPNLLSLVLIPVSGKMGKLVAKYAGRRNNPRSLEDDDLCFDRDRLTILDEVPLNVGRSLVTVSRGQLL